MTKDAATTSPAYQGTAGQRLAFRFQSPSSESNHRQHAARPHVVFCGGFHSNMLGTKATALARFCADHDWSYTRFDYRGHGESEASAAELTLHDWLTDTLDILSSISGPVILVGSSMGAWLATRAALQRPEQVQGLLLIAAAPDFLQELVQPHLSTAECWDLQQGQVVGLTNHYGEPFPITQALLESGQDLSLLSPALKPDIPSLDQLSCPVRLIHGTGDTDVPMALSVRLMNGISHDDARLTLLHQADHRLSDERSLQVIHRELCELIKQ